MNLKNNKERQTEPQQNNDSAADSSQVSPTCPKPNVIGGFVMVREDKEFKFRNLCPYCKGNLTYTCNGWEQDDNGLWMADSFDMDCSTEPDMSDEDEWEEWFKNHSEMPYVHQMPVDNAVKEFINKKYRFELG